MIELLFLFPMNFDSDKPQACLVPTPDSIYLVEVLNWEEAESLAVPNAGTTRYHFFPCLPVECPEPYTLVSTACRLEDPFDHVPWEDTDTHEEEFTSLINTDNFSVDVGPLIEPGIPTL